MATEVMPASGSHMLKEAPMSAVPGHLRTQSKVREGPLELVVYVSLDLRADPTFKELRVQEPVAFHVHTASLHRSSGVRLLF